jgi:hypothetical protein
VMMHTRFIVLSDNMWSNAGHTALPMLWHQPGLLRGNVSCCSISAWVRLPWSAFSMFICCCWRCAYNGCLHWVKRFSVHQNSSGGVSIIRHPLVCLHGVSCLYGLLV